MRSKVCVITASGKRVCGRPTTGPSGAAAKRPSTRKVATRIARSRQFDDGYVYQLSAPLKGHRYVTAVRLDEYGETFLFPSDAVGHVADLTTVLHAPRGQGVAAAFASFGYDVADAMKPPSRRYAGDDDNTY